MTSNASEHAHFHLYSWAYRVQPSTPVSSMGVLSTGSAGRKCSMRVHKATGVANSKVFAYVEGQLIVF